MKGASPVSQVSTASWKLLPAMLTNSSAGIGSFLRGETGESMKPKLPPFFASDHYSNAIAVPRTLSNPSSSAISPSSPSWRLYPSRTAVAEGALPVL